MTKKKLGSAGFGVRLRDTVERVADSRRGAKGEIAAQVGISLRCLQHWYTGDSKPDIQKIEVLARVLGVPPAWLAFGVGDATTEKGEAN